MSHFNRANATIAYLVMVLLLGGASAAGLAGNALLQVSGAVLIGWTLWSQPWQEGAATGLRWFGLALAILVCVQFVPLPPALWPSLPGRHAVARGFDLLGGERPWLMYSLAPWTSLASVVSWVPALALFVAMRSKGAPPASHAVLAVVGVALVSVVIGAYQELLGSGYFYLVTNFGLGPGFFANSNHQGSFLLGALALWSGHVFASRPRSKRSVGWLARPLAQLAIGCVLAAGVLVSGSLACYTLLVPALAGIFLISRPTLTPRWPALLGFALLFALGFLILQISGLADNDLMAKSGSPGISRQEFLVTGLGALRDFAPFGSGIGTFPNLYPWYENGDLVSATFVNHAHDDLLEVLIETGVFGLAALALFLRWYVSRTLQLWQTDRNNTVPLGASLLIGVELVHSLVDYPLRTAAMSSLMALACVLLVRPNEAPGRTRAGEPNRPRTR